MTSNLLENALSTKNLEVLGNYVLIRNPYYGKNKESIIKVEGSVKDEILMAQLEKSKRLKIEYAGIDCKRVKIKDDVYVETSRLMHSPRVALDENTDYFIVREQDIVFIYRCP